MLITLEQMEKLHAIQLEMFQELKRVMEELDVCYYMVHGSLLGAIGTHEFIAEDDDIDIAVFREDYERLLEKGNDILPSKYFIQSSKNDDFPLSFAKLRNKETEFYQPVIGKYKCNKGVYIDIFPIDFAPKTEGIIWQIKKWLLETRVNARLKIERSWKEKCLTGLSVLLYPSFQAAVAKREALYASCSSGEYVTIFEGKGSEKNMPSCWFGEGVTYQFCGMDVNCPVDYDAYLTRIYGANYRDKNPAEHLISKDKRIEISASYIHFGDGDVIGSKPTLQK